MEIPKFQNTGKSVFIISRYCHVDAIKRTVEMKPEHSRMTLGRDEGRKQQE